MDCISCAKRTIMKVAIPTMIICVVWTVYDHWASQGTYCVVVQHE